MGHIFEKLLKIDKRAAEYYHHAVTLAVSMSEVGVNFDDIVWFSEARTYLEERQQRLSAEEQERLQKEREKYIKERFQEHEDLKKANEKDNENFLKYVLDTYESLVTAKEKRAILKIQNQKKKFIKVISVFHSDRHASKPKADQVLYEEVCKYLNNRYERFKM